MAFPLPPDRLRCKKLSLCCFHTPGAAVSPLTVPAGFRSLCFWGLPCLYHCKYSVYFDKQNSKATVARTLCGFRRHCHSGMWEVNKIKQTKNKHWQPRKFRVKVHFANTSFELLLILKTLTILIFIPYKCLFPPCKESLSFFFLSLA